MTKWLALGIGTLGLLAACSTTTTTTDPFPSVSSFCTAKAQHECSVAAQNCGQDPAACQTQRAALCEANSSLVGSRKYTSGNVQACLDAIDGAYKDGKLTASELSGHDSMTDKCQRVFNGTVDNNGACMSDYDCINSRICVPGHGTAGGKICADQINVKAMQHCDGTGSVCESGTYCDAATVICTPVKSAGQPCMTSAECGSTLRCTSGVCNSRGPAGSACTSNDDCAPLSDNSAALCDPTFGNRCDSGEIFAPGAAACAYYGGNGMPVDAGADTGSGGDSGGDSGGNEDAAGDAGADAAGD